jgi:hypothetical protein
MCLALLHMHVLIAHYLLGLDDGDRLHDSTLLYIILVVDVLPLYN